MHLSTRGRIEETSNHIQISQPFSEFPIYRKAFCPCGGGCPVCQAKSNDLQVSQPNDPAEIEADQIADLVMRMPVGEVEPVRNALNSGKTIQRACDTCDNEEDTIQRKALPSLGGIPSQAPAHVQGAIGSGGVPLDHKTRSFFEPRFGYNLSAVRIHIEGAAAESTRALNARAYTLGNDIVFGSGEYKPGSESGNRLLAHELAHVIQQQKIAMLRRIIQRTTIGRILDEYFSLFSGERLWVMPESDYYTGIVRRWQPVINAVNQAKANIEVNCTSWNASRRTDSSWRPGMTDPPNTDPNAYRVFVPNPPGTDPGTCGDAFGIFALTRSVFPMPIETSALYTCSIGSFNIYVTVDSIDCGARTARMNIWMYNAMSRRSFGRYARHWLFRLSGQQKQYMWWNWGEVSNWSRTAAGTNTGRSHGWL